MWQVLCYRNSMSMKNLLLAGDVELYPGPGNTTFVLLARTFELLYLENVKKTLSSNFKNVLCNHCKNSIRFKCILLKKKVAYWVYHTCNAKELPFSNEVFIEIDATFMQSDNKEHQSSGFKLVSWGTVKRPLPNSN